MNVWQRSIELADLIYELTKTFPDDEKFGLVSQLRRASVSISSNLAEGISRRSFKEQAHFTSIAFGSLMEVLSQSILSERKEYISKNDLFKVRELGFELSNKINALRKYQLAQKTKYVEEPRAEYGNELSELEPLVEQLNNLTSEAIDYPIESVEQLNDLTIEPDYFAHPTAIIDPKVQIGQNTKIWHFSHIMSNSVIGETCNIGQNVVVSPDVKLGNNVKVQNNVSIYTGVICEDDVFLGPSMVFTNVINPRSAVNRKNEYLQTIVRKGATIGANATIVCGHNIGKYAFIGAGAVVTKEIPDYALVVGNPAKQIGWMSEHGERLVFDENGMAVCSGSRDRYLLEDGVVVKRDLNN